MTDTKKAAVLVGLFSLVTLWAFFVYSIATFDVRRH